MTSDRGMPPPQPLLPTSRQAPAAMADRLALRPREAARVLSICEKTLWSWTKSGLVPHVKIGRNILYPVDSLRHWLAQQAARGGKTNG